MDTDCFQTNTLQKEPWGLAVARILCAAVAAVDPATAIARWLRREGTLLYADGQVYDLARYERVLVIGAGKAGGPMARAVSALLGAYLTAAVIVVKHLDTIHDPAALTRTTLIEAGHPVPDARSVAAAQRIAQVLASTTERDLVIVLISGGGSALLTLPPPGIALTDLQLLTEMLLGCGARIDEINTLRKHLDGIKGGGLARLAAPATLLTLILSDVVGNPLDIIASGPTVPDASTFTDAYGVLERYQLASQIPTPILRHLQAGLHGERPETPKAGDPIFAHVHNLLIGSNQQAAEGARIQAQAEGFNTCVLTSYTISSAVLSPACIEGLPAVPSLDAYLALLRPPFQGEARQVGQLLAGLTRLLATTGQPLPWPACLIAGGETTVTLQGSGRGGRNQELALAAVQEIAGLSDVALVTLATDGGDGPTDAAGAVVTGQTLDRAKKLGLDPATHLAHNNAYPFFQALGDLLRPGPTQTNVNDLAFVFAF